jgi:hypothetical protein
MWQVKIIRVNEFAGASEILLAHLNFAGAVFEAKVAPAKDPRQQNSAGLQQKIPSLQQVVSSSLLFLDTSIPI